MYKCMVEENNVYVLFDEEKVAELTYSACEGNIIVDWVSVDSKLGEALGSGDYFSNYFSLLKRIGKTINAELYDDGKILWGRFPEIKEFDEYAKMFDANKKKEIVTSKGKR